MRCAVISANIQKTVMVTSTGLMGLLWLAPLNGQIVYTQTQVTTSAVGEGCPPDRNDLSEGQRRLMAKRAAEVRAIRDALAKNLGAPDPSSIGTGQVELRGQVAGFRIVDSRELPDGRWQATVEVELPKAPRPCRAEPVGPILNDYLLFRSGMMLSRQRCQAQEARLQHELESAVETIRTQIDRQLRECRADLAVIDRALADLEEKTVNRLGGAATAPSAAE